MKIYKNHLKLICLLLVVSMLFSACKKTVSEEPVVEDKVLTGFYHEENVSLDLSDTSRLISFSRNESEELEVFYVDESIPKTYGKVTQKGNEWIISEENWIADIDLPKEFEVNQIFRGEDGFYYVLFQKCDMASINVRFYQIQQDNSAKEIVLSGWEDEEDSDDRHAIKKIGVLKNGNIIVKDYTEETLFIYQQDGSVKQEESLKGCFTLNGNNIYAIDTPSCMLYTIEGDGKETKIAYDSGQVGEYLYISNDILWYAGKTGINRLNLKGSMWQNVIAGENTCMADESTFTYDFAATSNGVSDEYYYIADQKNQTELIHYYYDEEKTVTKDEKLVIYGLRSSGTINNAISMFRKKYPNVQVEYQVGYSMDNTATTEELIRTFNAELLAGKGPDVIVFDGMPIESYKEKQILLDLSETLNPMLKEDMLYSNIVNSYQEPDGIYTVPLRFQMVGMYGYQDVLDKLLCMDSIDLTGVNGEYEHVFVPTNFNAMARIFYLLFKNRLVKDQVAEEEQLKQFLTNLKYLSSNCSNDYKSRNINYFMIDDGMISMIDLEIDQDRCITNKESCACIYQYRRTQDLHFPLSVINGMKIAYSPVDHQFIPSAMVGINKNGENQELAKKFLEVALDYDAQETYVGDGFPLNKKAFDSWTYWLSEDYDNDDLNGYPLNYPTVKEFEQLKEMIPDYTNSLNYDRVLDDRIIELIQSYLEDTSTLEDTLFNILSVIQLHNAE